jgi:hypothetical protein
MNDDVWGDMNRLKRHRRIPQRLDQNTAERMFAGLAAADAPPDYAAVAAVLAAAAAPVSGLAAPGEAAAVRAYRDAVYTGAPLREGRWFQPWRTVAGRFAVVATAGALAISGGVAAAATGSLPAPAQRVAHQVLGDLVVPAATSHAVPAAVLFSRAADVTPKAPGSTTSSESTTVERPVIRVIPPQAAASTTTSAASTTTSATTTSKDAWGVAVSSAALSVDPGPNHGAVVCAIASDDACAAGVDGSNPRKGQQKNGNSGVSKGQQNGNSDRGVAPGQQKKGTDGHDIAKTRLQGHNGNGAAKGQQKGHGNDAANPGKGHNGNGAAKGQQKGHQNGNGH